MSDLKMDDEVVITIRARVYDVAQDRSERAARLTVLLYGDKKYWLVTEPGSVAIAKVEPAPVEASIAAAETGVSEERVEEILQILNSFADSTGPNLREAVDWALDQTEVSSCGGPDDNGAEVELVDGTVFEFGAAKRWFVTSKEVAE